MVAPRPPGTRCSRGGTIIRVVVTGAAGFIGSNLVVQLIRRGHEVTGIDSFTDYYDPQIKRANAQQLTGPGFTLVEGDVQRVSAEVLDEIAPDVVLHLAGQPGVRKSWGTEFGDYSRLNVDATQALLEAAISVQAPPIVLFASSSSVYGERAQFPSRESDLPRPHSPYGVTKLAAEHLVGLYRENFGLRTSAFRFFTVYGPGQRPDMAFHRFLRSALSDEPITIFGTGEQIRDFTYVGDIVGALVKATEAKAELPDVMNLSGGSSVTVNQTLDVVREVTGRELRVDYVESSKGDVSRTGGDSTRARDALGWEPRVSLREGIGAEAAWMSGLLGE